MYGLLRSEIGKLAKLGDGVERMLDLFEEIRRLGDSKLIETWAEGFVKHFEVHAVAEYIETGGRFEILKDSVAGFAATMMFLKAIESGEIQYSRSVFEINYMRHDDARYYTRHYQKILTSAIEYGIESRDPEIVIAALATEGDESSFLFEFLQALNPCEEFRGLLKKRLDLLFPEDNSGPTVAKLSNFNIVVVRRDSQFDYLYEIATSEPSEELDSRSEAGSESGKMSPEEYDTRVAEAMKALLVEGVNPLDITIEDLFCVKPKAGRHREFLADAGHTELEAKMYNAINCLKRIRTVRDIVKEMEQGVWRNGFKKPRCFGEISFNDMKRRIQLLGVVFDYEFDEIRK